MTGARGRSGRGGFLLLEVILAMALLAIAMFALIEGLNRCVAAAHSVQNYGIVETLLANKCYEFRNERPTDYLDQDGRFEDYPSFSWARRLEATETEKLWKQTISVSWYERGDLRTDSVVEYRYLPEKQ